LEYHGKIIDAHAHIYPEKIAEKATRAIGDFYSIGMAHVGTAEELAASGRSVGIKRQLVCSTATSPQQVESINDFIAAACAENPTFFGFGTMHPDYQRCEKELERLMLLGLRGIKLHTDFQQFYIDDERAFGMYEAVAEAGLPILFHIGDDRRPFSEPAQLCRVMKRVPKLVAIAAHFGGYRRWSMAADNFGDIENIFFDTSSSLDFIIPEIAAMLIEKLGEDRFFFGTDFPMWDHAEELERFMKIPLGEAARKKILWENFERLFKL